jgi:DNA polymerase eta
MQVHVATYREGATEAGYYEGAIPETHKVSLDPYRRESLKILKVFAESCQTIGASIIAGCEGIF